MKALALLLIFASFASAEIPSHLALWGGATADLVSTRMAIHRGAHEANPLVGQGWKKQAGVVYSMTAITEAVSIAAERDGHPKLAKWTRHITGGIHFGAMGWNLHVWSSLKR